MGWLCCCGSTGCTADGCCPGVTLGDTLTCTDVFWSTFGGSPTFTLTRTAGTCVYNGCLVVPYCGGDPPCANVNAGVALHYQFDATNCTMSVNWKGTFVFDGFFLFCCPMATDCSSTPVSCGFQTWTVLHPDTTCSPFHVVFEWDGSTEPQLVPWRTCHYPSSVPRIRIDP